MPWLVMWKVKMLEQRGLEEEEESAIYTVSLLQKLSVNVARMVEGSTTSVRLSVYGMEIFGNATAIRTVELSITSVGLSVYIGLP